MQNINDRIIEALDSTGKKDAEIAREVGISKSAITQWRKGHVKGMRAETAAALERATGYSATWLATGRGNKLIETNVEAAPDIGNRRKYPLISFVQAGNWCTASDLFQPGDAELWLECVKDLGAQGYVLRVKGESMTNPLGMPSFPDGILIFINPNAQCIPGDYVIAKRDQENEATFKQYKIVDGAPYLHAINPAWPNPYIKMQDGDRLCGKVEFAGFTLS